MPKYWGKQIFSLKSFPKWVKSKRWRKRKRRLKVANKNAMASYALQTPPRVAHAKPPEPTKASYACHHVFCSQVTWTKNIILGHKWLKIAT